MTHARRAPVLPALARSAAAARVTCHQHARACDVPPQNPTSGTTECSRVGEGTAESGARDVGLVVVRCGAGTAATTATTRGGHRGVERAAATRIRDTRACGMSSQNHTSRAPS